MKKLILILAIFSQGILFSKGALADWPYQVCAINNVDNIPKIIHVRLKAELMVESSNGSVGSRGWFYTEYDGLSYHDAKCYPTSDIIDEMKDGLPLACSGFLRANCSMKPWARGLAVEVKYFPDCQSDSILEHIDDAVSGTEIFRIGDWECNEA